MNKEDLLITVAWIKRALGVIVFFLWAAVILNIATSSAPFMEQAPYCMGSTMLIFGLLTATYKGLDYWVLKNKV